MSPEEIQKRNTMMRDMLDKVHAGFMELLGDKDNLEDANAELTEEVEALRKGFDKAAAVGGENLRLTAANADLKAKLAEAEKESIWGDGVVYEDDLNVSEPGFDFLYDRSKVDGVRLYPKLLVQLVQRAEQAEKRVAELEARIKELNADVWDLKLTPLPKSDPTPAVVSEPVNFQAANAELKIERGESVPGKVGKV